MYRLLLVDDEVEIVDWLYELFQEVADLELDVYKALSGHEALDILGRTKIDVVVSDIRMPGINGLQLMEKIRSRWPLCRVIFLTGYTDFDSVYTAIQADGVSYLLKTEEDERIVDAVRRAIDELAHSARTRELLEHVDEYLAAMLPYRQKEYVSLLVQDAQEGARAVQPALDELHLDLRREAPLYLAVARFDGAGPTQAPLGDAKAVLALYLRAGELLETSFAQVCALQTAGVDALWLVQPRSAQENCGVLLGGLLESLQDHCRQSLGCTLSAAYWSEPVGWDCLYGTFGRLRALLGATGGVSPELLLNERSFLPAPAAGAACAASMWRQMDSALERADTELFLKVLGQAASVLRAQSDRSSSLGQETYYRCATVLLGQINRRHGGDLNAIPGAARLLRADEHESWAAAGEYLVAMGTALFRLQRGMQESSIRESVERIQLYIREHLGEDLSLMRLSEVFYFNPSYLSRLFKQSTGQNLTETIARLRLERAQELLMDRKLKIADITAAVGFDSQHYFSRFFKKHTGVTPQEYRESGLRGG